VRSITRLDWQPMLNNGMIQTKHLRIIPSNAIFIFFKSLINSSLKSESKLVLMNVGLGLSPSPMSISYNLSGDINPRPNFPSVPSIGFSIQNYYKSRLLGSAVDHC
jgi:hypothetical protein